MEETTQRDQSGQEDFRNPWGSSYLRYVTVFLLIITPALLAAMLGMWLDLISPGSVPWTVMLVMAGLGIGLFISVGWFKKEARSGRRLQQ